MRPFLETNKKVHETLADIAKLFQALAVIEWFPVADDAGPGYTVKFSWHGKIIPISSRMQPTKEGNLRMCYRALHHIMEMETRGITGLVQRAVSEMGLVPSSMMGDNTQAEDYAILGLRVGASQEEIKRAFGEKAKRFHPDVGGDPDIFKALHRAYERLTR